MGKPANERHSWRRFWRGFLALGLGLIALIYAAILIVDPYDVVVFSPDLQRGAVAGNQRFAWPALARKSRYDSIVVGTSTTRLLKPAQLDRTLGGHFVNLSMNSGTAWEQTQILKLFARHHPDARAAIFGIDETWCQVQAQASRLTFREFPDWMYDDNPWNDLLHLLNLKTIEETGRQIGHLTGLRPSPRGQGAYHPFLPPRSEYDLARAQRHIYGAGGPRLPKSQTPPYEPAAGDALSWRYATHPLMQEMLAALPDKTLKIMLFVPIHRNAQPQPGSLRAAQLTECKRRLTSLAQDVKNAHVLDFMIDSRITRTDANYWDALHYGIETAAELGDFIAEGVRTRAHKPDVFRYLNGQ